MKFYMKLINKLFRSFKADKSSKLKILKLFL